MRELTSRPSQSSTVLERLLGGNESSVTCSKLKVTRGPGGPPGSTSQRHMDTRGCSIHLRGIWQDGGEQLACRRGSGEAGGVAWESLGLPPPTSDDQGAPLWIVVSIRIQTFRYQNEPIRCHVQVRRPGIMKGNAINSMTQKSRALETYLGFSRDPSWNPGFNMRFQEDKCPSNRYLLGHG